MLFRAISLNAARRARNTSGGIKRQGVVDGESKLAVVGCRDKSRRVGGHKFMIARCVAGCRWLSPGGKREVFTGFRFEAFGARKRCRDMSLLIHHRDALRNGGADGMHDRV